jgi:hypothetical protein
MDCALDPPCSKQQAQPLRDGAVLQQARIPTWLGVCFMLAFCLLSHVPGWSQPTCSATNSRSFLSGSFVVSCNPQLWRLCPCSVQPVCRQVGR